MSCIFSMGVVYMGCVGGIPMVYMWHVSVLYVCCLVCVCVTCILCHMFSLGSCVFCVCNMCSRCMMNIWYVCCTFDVGLGALFPCVWYLCYVSGVSVFMCMWEHMLCDSGVLLLERLYVWTLCRGIVWLFCGICVMRVVYVYHMCGVCITCEACVL